MDFAPSFAFQRGGLGRGQLQGHAAGRGQDDPLKRNITQDEVGSTAMFLCGPRSSCITGEVLYVDAGANIVAMTLEPPRTEEKAPGT